MRWVVCGELLWRQVEVEEGLKGRRRGEGVVEEAVLWRWQGGVFGWRGAAAWHLLEGVVLPGQVGGCRSGRVYVDPQAVGVDGWEKWMGECRVVECR